MSKVDGLIFWKSTLTMSFDQNRIKRTLLMEGGLTLRLDYLSTSQLCGQMMSAEKTANLEPWCARTTIISMWVRVAKSQPAGQRLTSSRSPKYTHSETPTSKGSPRKFHMHTPSFFKTSTARKPWPKPTTKGMLAIAWLPRYIIANMSPSHKFNGKTSIWEKIQWVHASWSWLCNLRWPRSSKETIDYWRDVGRSPRSQFEPHHLNIYMTAMSTQGLDNLAVVKSQI